MSFYSKKIFLDQYTPVDIYQKIKSYYKNEITFLFESTINSNSNDGNFSYIIIGQRERILYKENSCYFINELNETSTVDSNPLAFLKKYYKNFDKKIYKEEATKLGIGLVDGFIGNVGYDISKEFEPKLKSCMSNLKDEFNIPDLDLIRPNIILAFSHKTSNLTILTSVENMKHEIKNIENLLFEPSFHLPIKKAKILDEGKFLFSKEDFFKKILEAKEMINKGEIFQILISNRFCQKANVDNLSFYRILRSKNPSPYLFLLEYSDFCIAGSSPEVMIRLVDDRILLRPIAGTRKRGKNIEQDILMQNELLNDAKEKSEHLMLVDLGRNDVGKVAKIGSVKVTNLMRVEKYSHVMHMVSDIEGLIDNKYDMFDLFMATFTAGTMTGAPKIRAMELIAKLENVKRSFYSGSIAYFGFDGNMDSAITIRTTMIKNDNIIFQAGAGIVFDSIPELEYLEVQNKLAANISTLKDLT